MFFPELLWPEIAIRIPSTGMEPANLKKKFGNRISFHGAIDQQEVLTKGTVDDVEEEVVRRIRQLAPGGGYILASAHTIMPEVPGENVLELFKAVRKHGRYLK
jgi:uroporphyrinogen decarboxylase